MTPSPASCPRCGSPLDPASSAGLCPRCLLAMNLRTRTMPTGEQPSSSPPPAPAELEEKFPQFEILECLGRGGMGVVYKARQKALDRIVAIKILAGEFQDDPGFAARFEKEAKLLARLNHPNIVTIHDFGHAGGLFHIVMEYIDGVNVRDLLRDGRLEPQQALAIVPPICDALQFAHDHGVVHRDIKPENILLDREGRVKIADFGIATMAGEAADRSGTPAYMAPEIGGHATDIDHRADIYSLGVVLYEMLTGERPGKQFEMPSNRVLVDVKIDQIVLRALQGRPELRYQTAGEFKTVVETMANANTPPAGTPSAPATFPPVREPRPEVPEIAAAAQTLHEASPALAAAPGAAVAADAGLGDRGARMALILMLGAIFGTPLLISLVEPPKEFFVGMLGLCCLVGSLICSIGALHTRTGTVVFAIWCVLLGVPALLYLPYMMTSADLVPGVKWGYLLGMLLAVTAAMLAIRRRGRQPGSAVPVASVLPERESEQRWAVILLLCAFFGTPVMMSLVSPSKEGIIFFLGVACAIASLVFAIRARRSRTGKVVMGVWGAFTMICLGSFGVYQMQANRAMVDAQQAQQVAFMAETRKGQDLAERINTAREAIRLRPDAEPRIRIDLGEDRQFIVNGIQFTLGELDSVLAAFIKDGEPAPVRIRHATGSSIQRGLYAIMFTNCQYNGLRRITFWRAPSWAKKSTAPDVMLALEADQSVTLDGQKIAEKDVPKKLLEIVTADPRRQVRITALPLEQDQNHKTKSALIREADQLVYYCEGVGFQRIFLTTEAAVARSWQLEAQSLAGSIPLPTAAEVARLHIGADGSVEINGRGVERGRLFVELRTLALLDLNRPVRIETDPEVDYQEVLNVLDLCSRVSLTNVSFAVEPGQMQQPPVPSPGGSPGGGASAGAMPGPKPEEKTQIRIKEGGSTWIDGRQVAQADLAGELRKLAEQQPKRSVQISSHSKVAYSVALKVIEMCHQAGLLETGSAAGTVPGVPGGAAPAPVATALAVDAPGLTRIQITADSEKAWIDGREVARKDLLEELRQLALRQSDRPVQIETGEEVPYTELLRVVDLCSQAPLTKLSLVYRPRPGQLTPPVSLPLTVPPRGKPAGLSPLSPAQANAHAAVRIALAEDGSVSVDGKALVREKLLDELVRLKAERGDPYVEIATENSTSYTLVTGVLELCQQAGLTNLNLLQPALQEEPPLPWLKAEPEPPLPKVEPDPAQGIVLPGPPEHPPTQIFIDEDGFLLLDDEVLKLEELGPKLTEIARGDPYRKILVTGEHAATHERVLAVLKVCKEASLTQVSYQRAADRLREIELSAALKGYQDLQERLREARLKRDLLAVEGGGEEELMKAERVIEVLAKSIDEERERVKELEEK